MERRVRIQVPMAGGTFNWSLNDEVLVEEELAIALCTLPEDGPRATPVGWEIEHGKAKAVGKRGEKATDPKAD